jgi:hypothetical protein
MLQRRFGPTIGMQTIAAKTRNTQISADNWQQQRFQA